MEPSAESAGDIATAAVSACRETTSAYLSALTACDRKDGLVSQLRDALDQAGREKAIEIVVEVRASRHSRAK
jgi:hypothetical protein